MGLSKGQDTFADSLGKTHLFCCVLYSLSVKTDGNFIYAKFNGETDDIYSIFLQLAQFGIKFSMKEYAFPGLDRLYIARNILFLEMCSF